MTREEAIKIFEDWIKKGFPYDGGYAVEELEVDERKACKMAIQAMLENEELSKDLDEALKEIDGYERGLSQEPCEKCEVGNPCLYCEHEFSQKIEPCDECRNKRTSFCGNCKEYDEFEPCDDVISRDALISKLTELIKTERSTIEIKAKLIPMIEQLPSVTPKPIECDDATPKDIFCIGCDYKEQEHCTHYYKVYGWTHMASHNHCGKGKYEPYQKGGKE